MWKHSDLLVKSVTIDVKGASLSFIFWEVVYFLKLGRKKKYDAPHERCDTLSKLKQEKKKNITSPFLEKSFCCCF